MSRRREGKIFTTGEVAKLCKVAPRTVAKWFDSGRLTGFKLPGSDDRRIPRENLIRFLKESGLPLGDLECGVPAVFVVGELDNILNALQRRFNDGAVKVEACDSMFSLGLKLGKPSHDGAVVVGLLDSGLTRALPELGSLGVRVFGIRNAEGTVDPNVRKVCEDVFSTKDEAVSITERVAGYLLPRTAS